MEKQMSEKYTPGPWVADGPFVGTASETRELNHDILSACHDNFNQALANAKLIAAAPDMLEALEKAEKWLKGWASAEHELEIIQAAIAKAKGLDG